MTPTHSAHNPGPQIGAMLIVILSAVACAFLIVFTLVKFYGPTGQYVAEQVLLQPELLSKLTFQEQDPAKGKISQYSYDHIEYTYFDTLGLEWKKRKVTAEHYKQLVKLLSGDSSLLDPREEILASFGQKRSATLTIWVKNQLTGTLKRFQEIGFVPEVGLYRVELRQQDNVQPWAYFRHSHIYEDTQRLFEGR